MCQNIKIQGHKILIRIEPKINYQKRKLFIIELN